MWNPRLREFVYGIRFGMAKGGYPEIDDFGSPDDWRHFAAVEPRVGSWKKLPDLAPGETRTMVAEFSVR